MNPLSEVMNPPGEAEAHAEPAEGTLHTLLIPFVAGMAVNLLSLGIASPYAMMAVGLLVALVAMFVWGDRPFSWVVFVAVCAGNPANYGTPISLNLYSATIFFVLTKGGGWSALPKMLKLALFFVLLCMVVSVLASLSADLAVPSIHTTDVSRPRPWMVTWSGGASMETLASQAVSGINYALGPFLFIPLIFSRIKGNHTPELLVKGLLFGLVLPTVFLFMASRTFGQPVMDSTSVTEGMLNVTAFRLGKIDIQMLRTQVGIPLAALICASFAVAISPLRRWTRLLAAGCLITAGYILLVTGSVGSTLASLAGITVILSLSVRHFSVKRYVVILLVGGGLALTTLAVLPENIQRYATSRYELRVGKNSSSTADRAWRWKKAFNYLIENPSGVGWSIYVEPLGTYPHNDYLTYGIAFGVVCGLVYLFYPSGLLLSFISFAFFHKKPLNASRLALALAGAGVSTAVFINSMSDHLTANRWYFNVVWSLIWYCFFASRAASGPFDIRAVLSRESLFAWKERAAHAEPGHRRHRL
ncbi:MAG TPA: O-antigen ligase family protein [Geothrix sp.]|nr:O-antigen ligase family protein [Geothrix sp.]